MKRIFLCVLTTVVISGIYPAFSLEKPEKKVVLSEIIQEALSENPKVKAAQKEWEAALKKIPQAKSLPDPILSYSHFGKSVETKLGPQRNKISLSQRFPFFGKLYLKGEIAQSDASFLEEQYMAMKADLMLKVKKVFFSLYWFDEALKIAHKEKEVLQHLARVAQKTYETGKGRQQDVLKAQLEISKILDRILTLKQGRKAAVAGLNGLLNRPQDSFVGEVEEFKVHEFQFELTELYKWARENRPELKKVKHLIEKNERHLRLAKKNYFPDFNLMFDYIDIGGGTTSNPEDGRNSWMGSVGINIPLWRKRLHAAEAEAAIKLKASETSYKDVENDTLSRVNELFFEAKTTEEQIKLYKFSLLPQAEQSFKASEIGYLAGKVDFLDLLESERMVLMVKTGYHRAISDFGKSLARLERITGKEIASIEEK